MPVLPESRIAALLTPYIEEIPPAVPTQLSLYLDLLLKWNARTNLTAIRDPEQIVQRHFGESLFTSRYFGPQTRTLLDLGSGAGFPGLPIALLHPEISVTLAESQNKKAAFLREAMRTLEIHNVTVWPNRAESLPPDRRFDTVTLRAVDNMPAALAAAIPLAAREVLILAGSQPAFPPEFMLDPPIPVPESQNSYLFRASRR